MKCKKCECQTKNDKLNREKKKSYKRQVCGSINLTLVLDDSNNIRLKRHGKAVLK